MVPARLASLFLLLPLSLEAAESAGRAAADWVSASGTYQAGEPLRTALRLRIEPGWHTYWDNPGEGGMPIDFALNLPNGWSAGEIGRPVPVRFITGDLPGFGYEGEVLFPVVLHPPAGATGPAEFRAELSWLACSEDACVPGETVVELRLMPGEPAPTAAAAWIEAAEKRVPAPAPDAVLELVVGEKSFEFRLCCTGELPDPAACEVFPLTPQVVDAGAVIRFRKEGGDVWVASAPRGEFAIGAPAAFELVFSPLAGGRPFRVGWKR